jgi:hypothetical protein
VLIDPYVSEKLRELEAERARRASLGPQPTPVLGPLARAAGRALRRMGEGLESWANPTIPGQAAAAAPLRSREEGCEGC